jgi:hypothetical protein
MTAPPIRAPSYFQSMSAVAHGREHGIVQFFTKHGALLDTMHGDSFGAVETTPVRTARYLCGAPLAVNAMIERLYTQFAWPAQPIRTATRNMLLVWGRVAQVPLPGAP